MARQYKEFSLDGKELQAIGIVCLYTMMPESRCAMMAACGCLLEQIRQVRRETRCSCLSTGNSVRGQRVSGSQAAFVYWAARELLWWRPRRRIICSGWRLAEMFGLIGLPRHKSPFAGTDIYTAPAAPSGSLRSTTRSPESAVRFVGTKRRFSW